MMDVKSIEAVVGIFERSSLSRMAVKEKDTEIVLERGAVPAVFSAGIPAAAAPAQETGEAEDAVTVRAPVVGTLFLAKDPESPPFVTKGGRVKKGGVLCLIEAMKMYSEIEAPCDGVVREILFKNGDLAEFDKPLFLIERTKAK